MAKETKKMIKKYERAKKINDKITILNSLCEYAQLPEVNDFLISLLQQEKDEKILHLIIDTIDYSQPETVEPLITFFQQDIIPLPLKEKLISVLGKTRTAAAKEILLTAFATEQEEALLDNIVFALTFFDDKKVITKLEKALTNDKLVLPVLTGLAKNEAIILSSYKLLKKILLMEPKKRFIKLQYEQIVSIILDTFQYESIDALKEAVDDGSIKKKITQYKKKQKAIADLLKKVEL
jgi:HEAT repeat protein